MREYKSFEDVKIGDDIWVVITEKDNEGTITNVKYVTKRVTNIEQDVNKRYIHLDSGNLLVPNDILLVSEGEYGFYAKLWNNKVYCSDEINAKTEVRFKLAATVDSLRKQRFYIDDLIKKLETQYWEISENN